MLVFICNIPFIEMIGKESLLNMIIESKDRGISRRLDAAIIKTYKGVSEAPSLNVSMRENLQHIIEH